MAASCSGVFTPSTLYVGSNTALQSLLFEVQELGSPIEFKEDPLLEGKYGAVRFGRDFLLLRLDGTVLVPTILRHDDAVVNYKFKFLLAADPQTYPKFRISDGLGHGTWPESVQKMCEYCEMEGISFRRSRVAIEGGNAHLFYSKEGEAKAVIGYRSVLLSFLALEEQSYFTVGDPQRELNELVKGIETPSDECLIMARNLEHYHQLLPKIEEVFLLDKEIKLLREIDFKASLSLDQKRDPIFREIHRELDRTALIFTPLSSEDRESRKYLEAAKVLQGKLELTKRLMSEEIGVEHRNIAFVPQVEFHIDLEMFIDPSREVAYVHRDSLVPEEYQFARIQSIKKYGESALKRAQLYTKTQIEAAERIREIGCKVIFVAGAYEADGEDKINFMNGVLIADAEGRQHYFTNDCSSRALRVRDFFEKSVLEENPALKIHYVEETRSILSRGGGGIRCLTWWRGRPQ